MPTPLYVKINDPSKSDNEKTIEGIAEIYIGSRPHPTFGYIGTIIIDPLEFAPGGDTTPLGNMDLPKPFLVIDSDGATMTLSHGARSIAIDGPRCFVDWDGTATLRVWI